jgi:endonuclease VIII-like 1
MPELAELRLTADYINQEANGRIFTKIKKNPVHKGADIFEDIDFPFTLSAESRGKELRLEITSVPTNAPDKKVHHLMMGMGMAGHFNWVPPGTISKHSHLKFVTEDGTLDFVDVRRFGNWKWGNWNKDRGPDPTVQFQDFIRNIKDNLHKKDFDKPIHEVLMNQRWFNGIGNYLRAEILYRVDVNPFLPAREVLTNHNEIYALCRAIPSQAYMLGGGELKDWKNPFQFETLEDVKMGWREFMLCYGKSGMATMLDKGGRRFWYDPKWNNKLN